MAAAHKVRIRFRGAPLPWRTVLGCAAREVVESVDACNVQRRLTREYPSASFSSTSAWTASSLCKPASDTASLSRASSCSQRRALASLRSFVLAASCSLPPGAAASVSAAAAASGIPWSLIAARQRTRSPPAGKRPPMLRRETVTRCRAALQSQIRTKRQNQEAWPCPCLRSIGLSSTVQKCRPRQCNDEICVSRCKLSWRIFYHTCGFGTRRATDASCRKRRVCRRTPGDVFLHIVGIMNA